MSVPTSQIVPPAEDPSAKIPNRRGSPTLRRKIKQTFRQVHRQYHSYYAQINDRLPDYLAQSTISEVTDDTLQSYFDEYSQGYPSQEHDSTESVQNVKADGNLPIHLAATHAFDEAGKPVTSQTRTSTLVLAESATIPPYRFCRPVARSVFREEDDFSSFGASIVINGKPETTNAYLLDSGRRPDLHDQPEREQFADIIARETWQRLSAPYQQPDELSRSLLDDIHTDIDHTRLLTLHGDDIRDLDLLRDLPVFPVAHAVDEDGKVVKRRAVSWGHPEPVHPESFDDDPKYLHLDAEEVFCALPSCRTFGCSLHLREWRHLAVQGRFDRKHLSPSSDLVPARDLSKTTACSKSCAKSAINSGRPASEWPLPEISKISELLDIQHNLNSCALRPAFPAYTCREIHNVIVQNQRSKSAVSSLAISPPQSTSSFLGCNCQDTSQRRCRTNCPCKVLNRTCRAELCHPVSAIESWDVPLANPTPGLLTPPCCSNIKVRANSAKWTRVGISRISGYGIFATENRPAGTFIFDYLGERILTDEVDNRELFCKTIGRNYNYEIDGLVIDAHYMGNEARFINTQYGKPNTAQIFNCNASSVVEVDGVGHIFISTSKDVKAGQELFLHYGDTFEKSKEPRRTPVTDAAGSAYKPTPQKAKGRRRG